MTDGKYGAYLRSVARTIVGDERDAEECVNDAYLKAWGSIPTDQPENLRAYLSRIVRNLAIDKYRRGKAEKRPAVTAAFDELADVITDKNAELLEDALALKTALTHFMASLSPRERMIFMRRYFYMDETKRIARMLTTTDGSVRVTLAKLRRKLRAFLEKEGIEQ